jgi:hypothetical protein
MTYHSENRQRIGGNATAIRLPFAHTGQASPMPKKDDPLESKNARPGKGERMPPPLGADLIAKLQAAVDAAQRRHQRQPAAESGAEPDEA